MNLIEVGRPAWRYAFGLMAKPAQYQQQAGAQLTIAAFLRGLRSDDLFASAMQQDMVAILDAGTYAALFPARPVPARYDRLRTAKFSYAVEEWRGSPNDDEPVFFKLLLRGGQQ
jgi:hypothetical protein